MKLTITGYYGANNLGDEAFVSVLNEYLSEFNPTFTDGKFTGDETHVLVGGGEIEPWMFEKGPPSASYHAIGVGLCRDGCGEKRARLLNSFKFLGLRDATSLQLAGIYELDAFLGADLALLLKQKECEHQFAGRDIIVPTYKCDYAGNVRHFADDAVILPMHPYDIVEDAQHEQHMLQSPEEFLYAIQDASAVITYGKLHACVLAQNAGVAWDCLDKTNVKCRAFNQMVLRHGSALSSMALASLERLVEGFNV